jgi:hypothetical protein
VFVSPSHVCRKEMCRHACACSFDNVDSDLTAGTQKIAAGGDGLSEGKQRLPSR